MEALINKISLTVVGVVYALAAKEAFCTLWHNGFTDVRDRITAVVGAFLGVFFLAQVFLLWATGKTSQEAWRLFDLIVGLYLLAQLKVVCGRNCAQ